MSAPLTPSDCDLQDSKYMPIYVQQLLNSSFNAMLDDTAWRAGVTLWLKSWHQVPAASLPANDEELCGIAGFGRDLKAWRKVREKAMRGWSLCDDGRMYHPLVAEAALEAWISMLMSRISSGAGNAKRWGVDFDPADIERQIDHAYSLLKALNPRADAVLKIDKRKATGKKPQSARRPNDIPVGYRADIPVESQPEPKPEPEPEVIEEVVDDAGATVDDLGWPVGMVAVVDALTEITPSDPRQAPWQADRRSIDEYLAWQRAGVEWQTIIDVITDLIAKKRDGPPATMAYFTKAILQSHANRQAIPIIPEAQTHERRSPDYKTAGERNQDSTVRAFGRIFGGSTNGEDAAFRDAG